MNSNYKIYLVVENPSFFSATVDGIVYDVRSDGTANAVRRTSQTRSVVVPDSITDDGKTYKVTSIEAGLFRGDTLVTSIVLPSCLTYIPDGSFGNCLNLESITLSDSLKEIGSNAFANCTALTSVYANMPTPPRLSESNSPFSGVNLTNCTLYVKDKTGEIRSKYNYATVWKSFGYIDMYQPETGIQSVSGTSMRNTTYDLQGRQTTTPAKGLYIVGGKKILK